jgi:hypothetical protein
LLRFYRSGRAEGTFETGVQRVLERVLTDPEFLFRIERVPAGVAPGNTYRISDLELASRLSFFLWSSGPDDELLDLAAHGRLKDDAVLAKQVQRMLTAPQAAAMQNFFAQWLHIRDLNTVRPDPSLFPEFTENIRAAFQRETDLFLESQLHEDRSAMDLLTANYTFVNEPLARLYGIPGVYGSNFRRVALPDSTRAGILGQGSVLTVTAYPNRTSPVIRGKWVLDNLLGAAPPPPPANVPSLPEDQAAGTMRERMEQHRKNPVCAGCHARMDPIGFALENFDAIGRWRTEDANKPIDATGTLPGGPPFNGPAAFRRALLPAYQDAFLSTVCEKLLTYALGRGVEYYDMPAVRKIEHDSAPEQYRWSALILNVVRSQPFHQ